jgi:hypothetical protein
MAFLSLWDNESLIEYEVSYVRESFEAFFSLINPSFVLFQRLRPRVSFLKRTSNPIYIEDSTIHRKSSGSTARAKREAESNGSREERERDKRKGRKRRANRRKSVWKRVF